MKLTSTFLIATGFALALGTTATASGNGPSYTAVVNFDGSLARGLGATGVIHNDKGIYEVDFAKDVTACGYTATIGLSGTTGSSDPGTVAVIGRSGTPNGVYVQTFNQKGKPADLGFHLIVAC